MPHIVVIQLHAAMVNNHDLTLTAKSNLISFSHIKHIINLFIFLIWFIIAKVICDIEITLKTMQSSEISNAQLTHKKEELYFFLKTTKKQSFGQSIQDSYSVNILYEPHTSH